MSDSSCSLCGDREKDECKMQYVEQKKQEASCVNVVYNYQFKYIKSYGKLQQWLTFMSIRAKKFHYFLSSMHFIHRFAVEFNEFQRN